MSKLKRLVLALRATLCRVLQDLFKQIGDKFFGMPAAQQAPYKLKEEESKLPENRVMVVLKAVTNPWTLGWQ